MIDPSNVPQVADDETLARYILQRSHIRGSDHPVKPDAFIPHPYTDLSVTRHLMATESELWGPVSTSLNSAERRFAVGPIFPPPLAWV